MELINISEYEHRSISSLKKSVSQHKGVSSKLSLKAIKLHLKNKGIYGICKHRANNIGINRTGDGYRDEVDPHHLRWDIYGNVPRIGVDPQKVQYKYGSRDGVEPCPPQNIDLTLLLIWSKKP